MSFEKSQKNFKNFFRFQEYAELSAEDVWEEDRNIEPDYIEDPEFAEFCKFFWHFSQL